MSALQSQLWRPMKLLVIALLVVGAATYGVVVDAVPAEAADPVVVTGQGSVSSSGPAAAPRGDAGSNGQYGRRQRVDGKYPGDPCRNPTSSQYNTSKCYKIMWSGYKSWRWVNGETGWSISNESPKCGFRAYPCARDYAQQGSFCGDAPWADSDRYGRTTQGVNLYWEATEYPEGRSPDRNQQYVVTTLSYSCVLAPANTVRYVVKYCTYGLQADWVGPQRNAEGVYRDKLGLVKKGPVPTNYMNAVLTNNGLGGFDKSPFQKYYEDNRSWNERLCFPVHKATWTTQFEYFGHYQLNVRDYRQRCEYYSETTYQGKVVNERPFSCTNNPYDAVGYKTDPIQKWCRKADGSAYWDKQNTSNHSFNENECGGGTPGDNPPVGTWTCEILNPFDGASPEEPSGQVDEVRLPEPTWRVGLSNVGYHGFDHDWTGQNYAIPNDGSEWTMKLEDVQPIVVGRADGVTDVRDKISKIVVEAGSSPGRRSAGFPAGAADGDQPFLIDPAPNFGVGPRLVETAAPTGQPGRLPGGFNNVWTSRFYKASEVGKPFGVNVVHSFTGTFNQEGRATITSADTQGNVTVVQENDISRTTGASCEMPKHRVHVQRARNVNQ